MGYSSWGQEESGMTEHVSVHTHMYMSGSLLGGLHLSSRDRVDPPALCVPGTFHRSLI